MIHVTPYTELVHQSMFGVIMYIFGMLNDLLILCHFVLAPGYHGDVNNILKLASHSASVSDL